MRIIEVTASYKKKIPTEQYGNKEYMASLKAEVESQDEVGVSLERLFQKCKNAVGNQISKDNISK